MEILIETECRNMFSYYPVNMLNGLYEKQTQKLDDNLVWKYNS